MRGRREGCEIRKRGCSLLAYLSKPPKHGYVVKVLKALSVDADDELLDPRDVQHSDNLLCIGAVHAACNELVDCIVD